MKNQFNTWDSSKLIFLMLSFFLGFTSICEAQHLVDLKPQKTRFVYAEFGILQYQSFSEQTSDDNFTTGSLFHTAYKAGIGLQVNRAIAFELGYNRQDLWISRKNTNFNPGTIQAGSSSNIDFLTLRSVGGIDVIESKLRLVYSTGYTLGIAKFVEMLGTSTSTVTLGSSSGITDDMIIQRTSIGISSGTSHHFELGAGIELWFTKNLVLFGNYVYSKGFKTLITSDVTYASNDYSGNFQAYSNGSFGGFDIGVKYCFK